MKINLQKNNAGYEEIPVDKIDIPHHRERSPGEFSNLVANIKKQGLIQPIRVCRQPTGRYTLIYGEGRLQAVKKTGWIFIPAQVVDSADDQQILLQWLTENLQRVDMSPKDKAINVSRLIDECGYAVKDVAERLGINEGYVRKLYAIISDGSEKLQKASFENKMVSVSGDISLKFKNKKVQDELLDVFRKEKVKSQKHQQILVKSVDKKTENVRKSIEKIRSELKRYRELVEIAYSRKEALIPNLEKLKKDKVFMNKLKIYHVAFKW